METPDQEQKPIPPVSADQISAKIKFSCKNIGNYSEAFSKGIYKKIESLDFRDAKGQEIKNWSLYLDRTIEAVIPDKYK